MLKKKKDKKRKTKQRKWEKNLAKKMTWQPNFLFYLYPKKNEKVLHEMARKDEVGVPAPYINNNENNNSRVTQISCFLARFRGACGSKTVWASSCVLLTIKAVVNLRVGIVDIFTSLVIFRSLLRPPFCFSIFSTIFVSPLFSD